MFNRMFKIALLAVACTSAFLVPAQEADAASRSYGRQYYSSWSYHPAQRYHYCRYYYRPTITTTTYKYHYVIHYPSRPRYRYYYNPVRRVYWGRYEVDCNGNAKGYSILAPADRKATLSEIDESKFPAPSAMPPIPESEDSVRMDAPTELPPADLPNEVELSGNVDEN